MPVETIVVAPANTTENEQDDSITEINYSNGLSDGETTTGGGNTRGNKKDRRKWFLVAVSIVAAVIVVSLTIGLSVGLTNTGESTTTAPKTSTTETIMSTEEPETCVPMAHNSVTYSEDDPNNPQYPLLYYSYFSFTGFSDFKTCHMKILSDTAYHDTVGVTATSKVNASALNQPGDLFGNRTVCRNSESSANCVEIKPPDDVGFSLNDGDFSDGENESVKVVISTIGIYPSIVMEIAERLNVHYGSFILTNTGSSTFKMVLQGTNENYGFDYGIYCDTGNTVDLAQRKSLYKCRTSSDSSDSYDPHDDLPSDTEETGYAVKFGRN